MIEPIVIGGTTVKPGETKKVGIRVARLFTGDWLTLPVTVLHGREPGPKVFLDAAIHGDELNGMEIIRRVVEALRAEELAGTVLAVPVVNVFGFVQGERYLPDRRDLNRSFPGSKTGSLAARLAELFLREVVSHCAYGIDLHTGSNHRTNLPQVRARLADPETRRVAEAFDAPMMYEAPTIGGSLRAEAVKRGIHLLVYEGGEPLRFDDDVIQIGVRGVRRVLGALGMAPPEGSAVTSTFEAGRRSWVRAPRSGVFYRGVELGATVAKGARLGAIRDFDGGRPTLVRSPIDGLVIGFTNHPLAHQGDALVHVARSHDAEEALPAEEAAAAEHPLEEPA